MAEYDCKPLGEPEKVSALIDRERQRNLAYQPPSDGELAAAQQAIAQLLSALRLDLCLCPGRAALAQLGLGVVATTLGGEPAIAIIDEQRPRRGWGIFIFRRNLDFGRPLLVEVPHSYFDVGTLPIGLAIAEAGAAALFVNTVHRYPQGVPPAGDKGSEDGATVSPQDMAHATKTFWQAMSAGFYDTWDEGRLLQLHGFADRVDPEQATRPQAIAILSRGPLLNRQPLVERYGERLAEALGKETVLVYGRDTHGELGGTNNAQGELLLTRDCGNFMHLELSRSLRTRLQNDAALLNKLAQSFLEPFDDE